jgi:glycogen debranching enzyme
VDPDRAAQIAALRSPDGWLHASTPPVDADDPGRFHALFGRDSLIAALQLLPSRPEIARATVRALAALQGTRDDPEIDEEPGKVIHEYRPVAPEHLRRAGWPLRDGGIRYYGTADATSWFLVVLAAIGDPSLVAELDGTWRGAAGWLQRAIRSGGGLVRHGPRRHPGGLRQQGWRDASDPETATEGGGILRPDGTAPAAPLADVDSQAVAVAALRALAVLEPGRAEAWRAEADALRTRLSGLLTPETMAVEAGDVLVPGAGSQLGWLLWAGALLPDAAAAAARRLVEPDVLTPYGLRTLASTAPQFRADGYHRGAVWPFDSWLGWAGLRAHGDARAAEQVRAGVLAALDRLGGAPELYAVGVDGDLRAVPIANRVQAWTVGAADALSAGWDGGAAHGG